MPFVLGFAVAQRVRGGSRDGTAELGVFMLTTPPHPTPPNPIQPNPYPILTCSSSLKALRMSQRLSSQRPPWISEPLHLPLWMTDKTFELACVEGRFLFFCANGYFFSCKYFFQVSKRRVSLGGRRRASERASEQARANRRVLCVSANYCRF